MFASLAKRFGRARRRSKGNRQRLRSASTKTLVTLPSSRDADPDVLAQLREVDPSVDLLYLGLGVWVLGSVQPNRERYKIATQLLASERKRPPELQSMGRFRMVRWQREGFRPIDFFDEDDIHTRRIVREFRFADWRYRHCPDLAFAENLRGSDDETDLQKRIALLLDYNASEQKSIWQYAFGGRRHIRQPGTSWQN